MSKHSRKPIIFMPDHIPSSRYVTVESLPKKYKKIAEKVHYDAMAGPGWNVKITNLRGDLHIIDACGLPGKDGCYKIKVALLRDHPMMGWLNSMDGLPKVVKNLYTKSVRTAHLRASENWTVSRAIDSAEKAWDKFHYDQTYR